MNERILLSCETEPGKSTRCKCEDKFCDVIIDGGNIDNLVSEEMISKMKLKREKHP